MHSGCCFCGELRFQLAADPTFACHCHCASCQKSTGVGFVTWVTFPAAAFALTSGALVEHHSSAGVTRGHCASCGTSITYLHRDRTTDIDVAAACLDDARIVEPKAHIWLQDKAPWIEVYDDLPKFQQRVTRL